MAKGNGHWEDLLDLWLSLCASNQSPPIFNLWSGLALLSSALERRVWVQTGRLRTYPNLYIMLVGAPGVGKQVVEEARAILLEAQKPDTSLPGFHIASDSLTRASMIDEFVKAKQVAIVPDGTISYNALSIYSEEFRVLLPAYDQDFISRLDRLYNNPTQHSESRRTGTVREVKIDNPTLNILAAAQPQYLANTFPDDVWATGISRRLIMIYAAEGSMNSIFDDPGLPEGIREEIVRRIGQLSGMYGLVKWTPEAAALTREFDLDWKHRSLGRESPSSKEEWKIPNHSRLVHYMRSRTMFVIKLGMISAIAQRGELVIRQTDIERALFWLLEAEELMPDIFREMKGKSDREVIEELHRFAMALWNRDRKGGVQTAQLYDFLTQRVPSEKVDRILALAEKSGVLSRMAGTERWTPRPIYDHRIE